MKDYSDLKFDWFSEISSKMGYGLQSRRILRPLIEGGADIKIIPDEDYLPPYNKINDPYWSKIIEESKNKPDSPIRISYCLPHRAKVNPNAINIMYAMWETDCYPREWTNVINGGAQYFFAGCNSLVASAKKAGITCPILPINATIDTKEWSPEGSKLSINEIPDTNVKFLFIGNFIPRKNLEDLLMGFAVAFDGCPDVSLIIKTWSSSNDANGKKHISEAIRHMYGKATGLANKPKISVISDILDESQIIGLIRNADAYVSVSKGEGFDLPMMQAMSLEKLIVTTRFLAHGDYLDDSNSINVKYSLRPCSDAAAPMYDSYQMWSSPDMDSFISALREAYKQIKDGTAKKLGAEARKTIESKFSEKVNTDRIADIIRGVRDGKYKPQENKVNIKDIIKGLAKPVK
jgi:glycosyltransferase involved in cell wall biosynthesis